MKKIMFIVGVLFMITVGFTRSTIKSGIHGTVDPSNGASKVWAISGTDTASAPVSSEGFWLDVKPGNWKLIIEAVKPYRNAVIENISVQEAQPTEVGLIKLEKD
jgi:hypothetical protein